MDMETVASPALRFELIDGEDWEGDPVGDAIGERVVLGVFSTDDGIAWRLRGFATADWLAETLGMHNGQGG